jgi:hypothetical protein
MNYAIFENCALLGCCAASSGNFVTDIAGQPIGPTTTTSNQQ